MALEQEPQVGPAYPYWAGWHTVGCAILFFGLLGSIGVSLLPAGYERVQTGDLPTGVAMMVMGVFGIPTLGMALVSICAGVRDTLRPPLLRVTATALVLPAEARGEPPQDEYGEPVSRDPPQPETVPFAAIRWVRRSGPRFNEELTIAHDLSTVELRIRQHMMRTADFDALEASLRAALPAAFLSAPPEPQAQ
ncbi:MAG: hypothetical protein J0I06_19955 [Planctomycetes bacterium]|nr:hypothetical protein [Planctomycetota bacterium]